MTWRIVPLVLAVQVAFGFGSGSARRDRMPEAVRKVFRPWSDRALRNPAPPGPQFMVDTSIVLGPSPAYDGDPDAATDGSGWLVAWVGGGNNNILLASRFSGAGAPLDTAPIRLSPPEAYPSPPRVAFNGTDYVVVWTEMNNSQVLAARVSTAGVLRDSVPIPLGNGWRYTAVSACRETCLVAWSNDVGPRPGVYAGRLTADGTALDPDGFLVSRDSGDASTPEVAAGTAGFLVAWSRYRHDTVSYECDVVAARVSLSGQVLDTVPIPVGAKQGWTEQLPATGFNGYEYLVAWTFDTVYDWNAPVQCRRVTTAGVIIDTAVITLPLAAGSCYSPDVAAESGSFLVTFEAADTLTWYPAVYGCRVSGAGAVLDSVPFLVSDSGCMGTMARVCDGPGRFLATWSQFGDGPADIRAARISVRGAAIDTPSVLVSFGPDEQYLPRAAACSTGALVAWLEERQWGWTVQAGRVSPDGQVLDPSGIEVTAGPCFQYPVAVGRGAGRYLVAWTSLDPDADGLYAARVTDDGVLLDTNGIAVCTTGIVQLAPNIAYDGHNFLITWSDTDTFSMDSRILGVRMATDGAILDPEPIVIADETEVDASSYAAYNGESYVVSWMAYQGDYFDLKFKRLRPDGVLLDTVPRILSAADQDQGWQSGAAAGETTLFVWMDYRSQTDADIYCARVLRDGRVLDPNGRRVSNTEADDYMPAVVWTGREYQAFWLWYGMDSVLVAGASIGTGGSVQERFSAAQNPLNLVSAAAFPSGNVIVAWDGYAAEYLGRPYYCTRAWARLGPFTGVAEPGETRVVPVRQPTVVRGMLRLPDSPSSIRLSLFDLSGREVRQLRAGANDVRLLPPGVYFVRQAGGVGQPVQKVVITK